MAQIALLTGPQDPSQLDATINQLIEAINPFLNGVTPILGPVVAGSTAANLAASGTVQLNSTTRAAGTTGRYTLSAPVRGQVVFLKNLSTSQAFVTGVFERSKTKLTLAKSTAALATAKLPGVILAAVSTSAWNLIGSYGPVTVSS